VVGFPWGSNSEPFRCFHKLQITSSQGEQFCKSKMSMDDVSPQNALNENTSGVFAASLMVFSTSLGLVIFYLYQFYLGRCNIHPIYVQSITMIVYALAAFSETEYSFVDVVHSDGSVLHLALGRYLNWIMTCPVILANTEGLIFIFRPEELTVPRITFLLMKDLLLISFGILASMQNDDALKYTFVGVAFIISGFLVKEILQDLFENKRFLIQYENAWESVVAIFCLFFVSWGVFPVLYLIGPPCFNLISESTDIIGHACADLFAKNLLGVSIWFTRFNIMAPALRQFKNENRSVVPRGITNAHLISKHENSRKLFSRRKTLILVVDQRPEVQRLFNYMMEQVDVFCEFAFDLDSAKKMIKKEPNGTYTAVLINLEKKFDDEGRFHATFKRRPFFLPVLGYTFDDEYLELLLSNEESQLARKCDGIIEQPLDHVHVAEQILLWKTTAIQWKEVDANMERERKLYLQSPGSHRQIMDVRSPRGGSPRGSPPSSRLSPGRHSGSLFQRSNKLKLSENTLHQIRREAGEPERSSAADDEDVTENNNVELSLVSPSSRQNSPRRRQVSIIKD